MVPNDGFILLISLFTVYDNIWTVMVDIDHINGLLSLESQIGVHERSLFYLFTLMFYTLPDYICTPEPR
jgi:hypothetical protein